MQDMVLKALDEAGGSAFLARQAEENPKLFLALVARVLPPQAGTEGAGSVQMIVQTGVPRAEDLDGDLEVYLNSSSPLNATSWAGTYRLGMGYTDSEYSQAIQLYGGTLTSVTNKSADATPVTNLYIFRGQNSYLARTLSMALIGKGVGWDAQKVDATLAALNLARNGLRNLT